MNHSDNNHKDFVAYLDSIYPFADKSRQGDSYKNHHTQKLWLAFLDSKYHTYSHHRSFNDDFNKIFGGNSE